MIATFPSTNILSSKKIDDEITQFKEIYERLYADSHDQAFNSVTFRLFAQLKNQTNQAFNSEPLTAAELLNQSIELVKDFAKKYQEFYQPEIGNSLERIIYLLESYYLFFKGVGLLSKANES